MMVWVDNLARLITDRNMQKGDLARKAGIDPATLSRILNDDSYDPGAKTLDRLAQALGVPTGDLFQAGNHVRSAEPSHRRVEYPEIDWPKLLTQIGAALIAAADAAESPAAAETPATGTDESDGNHEDRRRR